MAENLVISQLNSHQVQEYKYSKERKAIVE